MISPDRATIQMSLAGHLQAILAAPGQPANALNIQLIFRWARACTRGPAAHTEVAFPADAVLVCYTDGLVERRGEIIDVGIQRLCSAVESGPAETVCARIMTTLAAEQSTDDIALLAIHSTRRRQP